MGANINAGLGALLNSGVPGIAGQGNDNLPWEILNLLGIQTPGMTSRDLMRTPQTFPGGLDPTTLQTLQQFAKPMPVQAGQATTQEIQDAALAKAESDRQAAAEGAAPPEEDTTYNPNQPRTAGPVVLPQQPTAKPSRWKALEQGLRDPRSSAFLLTVASQLAQPRGLGQTGWMQGVQALGHGYNAMQLTSMLQYERARQIEKDRLEKAKTEAETGKITKEGGKAEAEAKAATEKATTDRMAEDRQRNADAWKKDLDFITFGQSQVKDRNLHEEKMGELDDAKKKTQILRDTEDRLKRQHADEAKIRASQQAVFEAQARVAQLNAEAALVTAVSSGNEAEIDRAEAEYTKQLMQEIMSHLKMTGETWEEVGKKMFDDMHGAAIKSTFEPARAASRRRAKEKRNILREYQGGTEVPEPGGTGEPPQRPPNRGWPPTNPTNIEGGPLGSTPAPAPGQAAGAPAASAGAGTTYWRRGTRVVPLTGITPEERATMIREKWQEVPKP